MTRYVVPRVNGIPVVRRSLVENLLSCRRFVPGVGEEAAFGTFAHEMFHVYVGICRATGEETRLVDVERIAREVFHRGTRGLHPDRLQEGTRLLDKFARDWPAELATLTRLEFTLAHDVGDFILTGTADREDRLDNRDRDDPPTHLRIRDYKTFWQPSEHGFQMRFYSKLRWLQPDAAELENIDVEIVYPRTGQSIVASFVRGELDDWWEKDVLAPLRSSWPGRYKAQPTGGSACTYCARRSVCAKVTPVARAMPTVDGLDWHFAETLRLSALLDERRKALWAAMRDRAPRIAHGHEYGYLMPKKAGFNVEVVDADGVADYMNGIQAGAGDAIRTIAPELISPPWLPRLAERKLIRLVPKKPRPGWRKSIEFGVDVDEELLEAEA